MIIPVVSCVSKKDVLYFQDIEKLNEAHENSNYKTIIRPDDLLTITVSVLDPKAAMPFNPPIVNSASLDGQSVSGRQQIQSYLVDKEGNIEFPVVGTLKLGGLTREEAMNTLKSELKEYLKDPIINLRILNFTITVLGEVQRPGAYTVNDERITVLEALGLAGDMSLYGKRTTVKVVREENGDIITGNLDFTTADLVNSPFYYLQQNDVVIVDPNGAQVQSSGFNRNSTVFISIAGILISVIGVLTR